MKHLYIDILYIPIIRFRPDHFFINYGRKSIETEKPENANWARTRVPKREIAETIFTNVFYESNIGPF